MKLTKKLLSVIISVALAASSLVFVVPASAQSLVKNVYASFTGTDQVRGDYISVSSTGTIVDKSLSVAFYNNSDKSVTVTSITSNNTVIISGFSAGSTVDSGMSQLYSVSGTTTPDDVLSVTVSYKVTGASDSSIETVSAYIYATTERSTSATVKPTIASGIGTYGGNFEMTVSPISVGTTSGSGAYPVVTASLYIDGSIYTTWSDYGLTFNMSNIDLSKRDHYELAACSITLSNNSGSIATLSPEYLADKTGTTTFEYDEDNATGYHANITTVSYGVSTFGNIPTAASTTMDIKFTAYGVTGGIFGVALVSKTGPLSPEFKLTVYNNNKQELRDYLQQLSIIGLNQGSYTSSSWNSFVTSLRAAYKQLGYNKTTAANVASALSSVKSAYANLVRYDTVVTNHNFYTDSQGSKFTTIQTDYNMKVTDGSTYTPAVISPNKYADYYYNRSSVTTSLVVTGTDENNYLTTVNQYYWYVDTSELESNIKAAKRYGNDGQNSDADGNAIYTDTSWNNLQTVITESEAVLADQTLFQASIDDASAKMLAAIKGLVRLQIDTSYLDNAVAWAEAIVYTEKNDDNFYESIAPLCYEVFDVGRDWSVPAIFHGSLYSNYDKMKSDYETCLNLISSGEITTADVQSYGDLLWQDIANLKVYDENGCSPAGNIRYADKNLYGYTYTLGTESENRRNSLYESDSLQSVFDDITDNTSGTYRLNKDDFTEDSWIALQDALYGMTVAYDEDISLVDAVYNNLGDMCETPYPSVGLGYAPFEDCQYELYVPAYTMLNNINFLANQQDMDSCRDNLLIKVSELEYNIDTTEVEELLAQAAEWNADNATAPSYARLSAVVEEANELLEKATTSPYYGTGIPQSELDKCIPELAAALDSMVSVEELRTAISVSRELADPAVYTQASIDDFLEKLSTFEELCASDATQSEIDSAVYSVGSLAVYLHEIPALNIFDEFAGAVTLDEENSVIKGITAGNTVAKAVALFDTNGGTITIVDSHDNVMSDDANVGTGYRLILSRDGDIYGEYTFIILGDVDGDSYSNSTDCGLIFDHCTKKGLLEGIYAQAADINGDGKVDLSDVALVIGFSITAS